MSKSSATFCARLTTEPACSNMKRIVVAGLLTGVIDGLFSSVLSAVFYGSTVTRLFQGVAATLLGPTAVDGAARTALIGVAMHFGVALGWSAVFAFLVSQLEWLRRTLAASGGPIRIASLYGPLIWMTMSLVIIPALTGRPAAITYRWWVQFFGHIPFVGLPIASIIGLPLRQRRRPPTA
jgi:hypothetical protein